MKKLIYLLLLLPLLASGQNMTSYINTNVRTVQPNPTKLANTFQALVDLDKAVNTSGTNAYTASVNAAITSYETGQIFHIKFVNANTTAVTLNINSIGVKTVKKDVSSALVSGDLPAGTMKDLYYDGTDLIIIGPVGSGGGGGITSLTGDVTATGPGASAATLATVNSNVGSFGSATQSGTFTVNAKGLITAASNVTITPTASSITGGAALSKTDDTNVTMTLGGSPTTSLLAATSLTLGWTGQLSASRGGTGLSSLGTGVATWLGTPSWTNFNSAITGTAPYWSLANGGAFTGNQTLTGTGFTLQALWTSLGIAQTNGYGLWVANTTAATNVLDQWSPSIVLEGNGWQSTGSTTSIVRFAIVNKPVSGSTNTQGNLSFIISKAGGAYTDAMILNSSSFNGISLTVGPSGSGSIVASALTGLFSLAINKTNDANSATALAVTSVYGSASGVSINNIGGFTTSSASSTYSGYSHSGTINQSGTASGALRIINLNTVLTSIIADKLIAFDWAPTGAGTSTAHLAWRNTVGNVLMGGSTITAGSVLVDMQSTSRGLLLPRVTNIASVSTPVLGLEAYDAATNLFNDYEGAGAWQTRAYVDKTQTFTNKTLTSPLINFGSDANGDLITRSGGVNARLGIGSSGQVLKVSGGAPVWGTAADVTGPSSAVDNGVARFDGTTGKIIQDTPVTITDVGEVVAEAGLTTIGGSGARYRREIITGAGSTTTGDGSTNIALVTATSIANNSIIIVTSTLSQIKSDGAEAASILVKSTWRKNNSGTLALLNDKVIDTDENMTGTVAFTTSDNAGNIQGTVTRSGGTSGNFRFSIAVDVIIRPY